VKEILDVICKKKWKLWTTNKRFRIPVPTGIMIDTDVYQFQSSAQSYFGTTISDLSLIANKSYLLLFESIGGKSAKADFTKMCVLHLSVSFDGPFRK